MIYLIWLLRIVHIAGGVFWVGGGLLTTFFIVPTMGAMGESGQKFVGHLMNQQKFNSAMASASGSTVLAGLILFWLDGQAGTGWYKSSFATGLSIGAGFAIIGMIFGMLNGRLNKAMVQLGAQIQGTPSAEQRTKLQSLQKQQVIYSRLSALSLILAVVFMSIARYLRI